VDKKIKNAGLAAPSCLAWRYSFDLADDDAAMKPIRDWWS